MFKTYRIVMSAKMLRKGHESHFTGERRLSVKGQQLARMYLEEITPTTKNIEFHLSTREINMQYHPIYISFFDIPQIFLEQKLCTTDIFRT